MWTCHRCGKPVYFAERRQSVGYDWHPLCLKCEECGKILQPGQHAQHKSSPYCHVPCYAALFGPNLFGHGSTTESHRNFGNRSKSFIRLETELGNKVKDYNRYYTEYPRCQLTARQVNGRLVLEGVLKVYWGTEQSIRLKQYEDNRVISRKKKGLSLGHQYASVEYDSDDNLHPTSVVSAVGKDDPCLLFAAQFGDLSIHFPPRIEDCQEDNNELQKWQTLTTLDKESKPNLNVQLLESLIDNKSIKLNTRPNMLQRSQSVKASSSDLKTVKNKNKKRFSCFLPEIQKEPDSLDSSNENLQSIGEDQSFCSDESISMDDSDVTNSKLDADSNECMQDTSINNETNCDNHTNTSNLQVQTDNTIVTKPIHPESLIEEITTQHNKKDSSHEDSFEMKIDFCDEDSAENSIIEDDSIKDISDESFKDSANCSIAENSNDATSEAVDDLTNDESIDVKDLGNQSKSESTDKIIFNDEAQVKDSANSSIEDSIELKSVQIGNITNDELIEVKLNDSEDGSLVGKIKSKVDTNHEKSIEPNSMDRTIETMNEEGIEASKKDRRPSIEFNVYQSRNPPKIKKSPLKYNLASSPDFQAVGVGIQVEKLQSLKSPPPQLKNEDNKVKLRSKGKFKITDENDLPSPATGPRALRRRKGGKMTRIRRRSSINGHWYDRETAVFTPPKDSAMSVWTTSLQSTTEVINSLLSKYKIESEATDFGLFVVKETGERRLVGDTEFPLLLRTNLGPHEDISKFYVMNKQTTSEISNTVAEFLRFSWAELRAFLNMFYEEEEKLADDIRYKYHLMRDMMQKRSTELLTSGANQEDCENTNDKQDNNLNLLNHHDNTDEDSSNQKDEIESNC